MDIPQNFRVFRICLGIKSIVWHDFRKCCLSISSPSYLLILQHDLWLLIILFLAKLDQLGLWVGLLRTSQHEQLLCLVYVLVIFTNSQRIINLLMPCYDSGTPTDSIAYGLKNRFLNHKHSSNSLLSTRCEQLLSLLKIEWLCCSKVFPVQIKVLAVHPGLRQLCDLGTQHVSV